MRTSARSDQPRRGTIFHVGRQPKVGQLDVALGGVKQDVLELEVAVDHAAGMHKVDGRHELLEVSEGVGFGQSCSSSAPQAPPPARLLQLALPGAQIVVHVASTHVLHRQIERRCPPGIDRVVQPGDVRVGRAEAQMLNLGPDAVGRLQCLDLLPRQDFECDRL